MGTKAYMTLIGCDAKSETLQLLNRVDLRNGRPAGWAAQHQYDCKQRDALTKAEEALRKAEDDVRKAQDSRPGLSQQRRLTLAKLAVDKATARVHAEQELLEIKKIKDRERDEIKKEKEERLAQQRLAQEQRAAAAL